MYPMLIFLQTLRYPLNILVSAASTKREILLLFPPCIPLYLIINLCLPLLTNISQTIIKIEQDWGIEQSRFIQMLRRRAQPLGRSLSMHYIYTQADELHDFAQKRFPEDTVALVEEFLGEASQSGVLFNNLTIL